MFGREQNPSPQEFLQIAGGRERHSDQHNVLVSELARRCASGCWKGLKSSLKNNNPGRKLGHILRTRHGQSNSGKDPLVHKEFLETSSFHHRLWLVLLPHCFFNSRLWGRRGTFCYFCPLKVFLSRDKEQSHWARFFFPVTFPCFHETCCSPWSGTEETGCYWAASPVKWGVEPESARDAAAGCLRINPHPFLPRTPANLFPFLCHGSQEHSWQYCSTCVSTDFIRAPWKYPISVCFINTITTQSPEDLQPRWHVLQLWEKSADSPECR